MTRTILALLVLVLGASTARGQERPADDLRARTERTRRQVETTKVSVRFEAASLQECVDALHELTGLSVAVSPRARAAAKDRLVTLRLRDVTVKSCLELVLGQVAPELRWSVSGAVLKVDVAAEVRVDLKLALYDASDVAERRPSFPAPRVGLDAGRRDVGGFGFFGCR